MTDKMRSSTGETGVDDIDMQAEVLYSIDVLWNMCNVTSEKEGEMWKASSDSRIETGL